MSAERIHYEKDDIIKVLRDLELLVVSTDRIGSAYHDRESDEQYNAMFVRFFDDLDFFRRLASARMILSEPFPYEAGEDGMEELERRFQDMTFWPEFTASENEQ
jgi:hypothetical protein